MLIHLKDLRLVHQPLLKQLLLGRRWIMFNRLAWMLFVGTNKMDLSFFFKFSAGFLALIAAGLGSHASYEFQKGEAFGAWGCKRICDDVWVPAVQAPFGTYASYAPYTDIAPHAAIDLDMRAFSDRMQADPPDFDGAWEIYDQGGNSAKGDSFRTLSGMAARDLTGEEFYAGFLSLYGPSVSFADDFSRAALDGAGAFTSKSDMVRMTAAKKNNFCTLLMYTNHEVHEALGKA